MGGVKTPMCAVYGGGEDTHVCCVCGGGVKTPMCAVYGGG